eukprot:410886-Pyramimonas_sp.AAC.1
MAFFISRKIVSSSVSSPSASPSIRAFFLSFARLREACCELDGATMLVSPSSRRRPALSLGAHPGSSNLAHEVVELRGSC